MSDPKDRLFRHLALLRLISRAPKSICTTELLARLKSEREKTTVSEFSKGAPQFDFPALDTPTALAFVLVKNHLNSRGSAPVELF